MTTAKNKIVNKNNARSKERGITQVAHVMWNLGMVSKDSRVIFDIFFLFESVHDLLAM